jgi:hypothetical protein
MALAPNTAAILGWLANWWPLFPIAAGVGSLTGFAVRRQPRSPFSGALLLIVGGVALAITLQTTANPLELYGRFWPLLLGVVALVEILRHYSWRPEMGELRPALFGAGKLALVGLVVVSGIGANRLAEANPNLLARISMPAGLDRLRDHLFGDEFTFDPIRESAPLPQGGIVSVTNRYGDVAIEAYDGDQVEVLLTPSVRAYDRAAAERVAAQLRLAIATNGQIVSVATNRGEIEHEISTNLTLRVPRAAALQIAQAHGRVAVSGVAPAGGTVAIDASHAPVEIRGVAAPIEVTTTRETVSVVDSSGSLSVNGRNDVKVSRFLGKMRFEDSDMVQVKDSGAPAIDLVSVDHATVTIENVSAALPATQGAAPGPTHVAIEGVHTRVTLRSIVGDVFVKTTHDAVTATDIAGSVEIEASHAEIKVTNAQSLRVKTDHDDVRVKEIAGSVEIANDHGDVVVQGFRAACLVQTTFDDVRLEAHRDQVGEVRVINEHGKIDVRLPAGKGYNVKSQVTRGKVRLDDEFETTAAGSTTGSPVYLETTNDDIVVRTLAGRQEGTDPA